MVILLGWHPPFSSFSSISGVWGANPLFLCGGCIIRIFANFRPKPPVFGRGPFSKTTVSTTLKEREIYMSDEPLLMAMAQVHPSLKRGIGVGRCQGRGLRGPAAILFISRDTCSDSIAKLFCACFYGVFLHNYRAIRCKNGVSRRCVCVKLSTNGGYCTILGKRYDLPSNVSHDMGCRSDSIAVSRDMGPLQGRGTGISKSKPKHCQDYLLGKSVIELLLEG